MSTEGLTEQEMFTLLMEDVAVPCDYDQYFRCGPAQAEWLMVARCGCGQTAHRLACDGCKTAWLATEDAAECSKCGEVFAPARKAFTWIERLG